MTSQPALIPGTTLSHYRLVNQVGEGGMGVVFRAVDTRLNRTVALKVVSPTAVADDQQRRRFLREARAASAFNHPNIVTIHEVDNAEGIDFIVMELVSGQSLARRIPEQWPADRSGARTTPSRSSPRSKPRTRPMWCTATSSRPT